MEIWKSLKHIQENGDFYEVSNIGRVRSVDKYVTGNKNVKYFKKGRILKPTKNRNGYLTISLKLDGKEKKCEIQRLVAKAFVKNLNSKLYVNHKDSDTQNNISTNLEWVTQSENLIHAQLFGNKKDDGENHTSSKISNEDAIDIRNLYEKKILNLRELGLKYNMSESGIWKVVNKKSYKNA